MFYPFSSDGCSGLVTRDWLTRECVAHDWRYWQGGNRKARLKADRLFYEAMRKTNRWRAAVRYYFVRVFGFPLWPFPKARWGYGWPWPYWKPEQVSRPGLYTVENQLGAYLRFLQAFGRVGEKNS